MDAIFSAYLLALRRRQRSPLTLKANEHVFTLFERWLQERRLCAHELSLAQCEDYFECRLAGHAVATVRRDLSMIRSAYRYAFRHELVVRGPTADVVLPRVPDREPFIYSSEDLRALYAAIRDERERLIFFLLSFGGLRLCEATSLTWQHVELEDRQLRLLGKGGKLRLVPLPPCSNRS